nr:DNA polymerase subunit gamma-2, mitochondrial [Aedes albopictus]
MAQVTAVGAGFRQLLESCRNSKFLGLDLNWVLKLTPIGRMLRNNLKEEFRRGEAGMTVYEGSSGITFGENLRFVRETFGADLSFGIALEERFENQTIALNENHGIALDSGSWLSCSYLVNPTMSMEFMYKIQRQRKIWWMRYACDPGRYRISDLRQDSNSKVQSVRIEARFAKEQVALEQLELIPGDVMGEQMEDFRVQVGGKSSRKAIPSVLRIKQCAELATLEVVLDSFESSGTDSVRIHRKLAPYKCGIVCVSEDASQLAELRDLARHLCNVLRKANIAVLDSASVPNGTGSVRSLNKQFRHLDSIAIPYSIVLRDQSLQNGLFQLRSRDTTLSETIHISDLPSYLLKIITS